MLVESLKVLEQHRQRYPVIQRVMDGQRDVRVRRVVRSKDGESDRRHLGGAEVQLAGDRRGLLLGEVTLETSPIVVVDLFRGSLSVDCA